MNILEQKFGVKPTTHYIKSLGASVKLRPLTLKEQTDFMSSMITDVDDKGQPVVDYKKVTEIKYGKIAAAMVEPKMTVEQLMSLSLEAVEVIDEIFALVDPKSAKAVLEAVEAEVAEGKHRV